MLHTKLQVFALVHSGHNFWIDDQEWQLYTVLNTDMLAALEILPQSPCFRTSLAFLSSVITYFPHESTISF